MLYGAINVAEMRKEWCRRRCATLAGCLILRRGIGGAERTRERGRGRASWTREGRRTTLPPVPLAPQETIELGYLLLIA